MYTFINDTIERINTKILNCHLETKKHNKQILLIIRFVLKIYKKIMKQRKKKKKYLFSQKIGQFICFFCLFELGSSTSMGKVEEQKEQEESV